jgi:DNA-binding MarR family transcriptional regulator
LNLENEIKTTKFSSQMQKAHLNIMFSNGWLRAKIIRVLKPYNLTPEQYNVLRILKGQYPKSICQKDITARMIDRNSNTTRIVEKLLNKNLVERQQSTHDRRELNITISKDGLKLIEELISEFDKQEIHNSPLTDAEATELNRLLDKMRADKS